MKRFAATPFAVALLCALWLLPSACTEKETSLGANIAGDGTPYNGQSYTFYADRALSVRDSALMTTGASGYNSYGVIGNYHDATYGSVKAILYPQIALPSNASDINFSEMTIDSVVLTLVKHHLYPDDTMGRYRFHFEVMQLAEAVQSDSTYYSDRSLPVNPAGVYYNQADSVRMTDTVLRLKLDNSIANVLRQTATADEFVQQTKGLRIRLTEAADEGMLSINFAATKTCLTVYYRYRESDTVSSRYTFLLGTGTTRFTQFIHDYSGSVTLGADSIDGSQTLYLEPMAGYNVLLSFDQAVRTFAAAHPFASIHLAELLLPVASGADAVKPDGILARVATGSQSYVDDLTDIYAISGFDGTYDASRNCFRLRLTQHVQGMLRNGGDPGTLLTLNEKQYNAARTMLKGTATSDPVRIEIVYSE